MELMTIIEAAKIFGVKTSTFRTWVFRKQIPEDLVIRVGNTVRIKKDKLEKFINA